MTKLYEIGYGDTVKQLRGINKWRLETDGEEPNPLFKAIVCDSCGATVPSVNLGTDYIYCPYCGSKNK